MTRTERYRPIKRQKITARPDAEPRWLRVGDEGNRSRANAILGRAMLSAGTNERGKQIPAPAYILVTPGHSAVWACKDVCAALEELASEGDQGLKLVGQVREGRM